MLHELLLTPTEKKVLTAALDLYIQLGLGQITTQPGEASWNIEDPQTSAQTIAAFGIQCRMEEAFQGSEWAARRLRELKGEET